MLTRERAWQVQFSDLILNQERGILFVGARRRGRGPWRRDLPPHVVEYLQLHVVGARMFSKDFHSCAELAQVVQEMGAGRVVRGHIGRINVMIADPLATTQRKPARIPKHIPAIRSLEDLCAYFNAGKPGNLNRRLYKGTDCGASISVQDLDGVWHHNGGDWSGIAAIQAFTIQTIIEGSDATVDSDEFVLPVTQEYVATWIAEMESQVAEVWREANGDDEDA